MRGIGERRPRRMKLSRSKAVRAEGFLRHCLRTATDRWISARGCASSPSDACSCREARWRPTRSPRSARHTSTRRLHQHPAPHADSGQRQPGVTFIASHSPGSRQSPCSSSYGSASLMNRVADVAPSVTGMPSTRFTLPPPISHPLGRTQRPYNSRRCDRLHRSGRSLHLFRAGVRQLSHGARRDLHHAAKHRCLEMAAR